MAEPNLALLYPKGIVRFWPEVPLTRLGQFSIVLGAHHQPVIEARAAYNDRIELEASR